MRRTCVAWPCPPSTATCRPSTGERRPARPCPAGARPSSATAAAVSPQVLLRREEGPGPHGVHRREPRGLQPPAGAALRRVGGAQHLLPG